MNHPIHNIISVEVVAPYVLEITFDNRVTRRVDLKEMLHGEMYAPLRDPIFFKRVSVDPEVHTIVWPNGADFDPAILYNWEEQCEDMIALARTWTDLTEQNT
jgi:hypothetical protein